MTCRLKKRRVMVMSKLVARRALGTRIPTPWTQSFQECWRRRCTPRAARRVRSLWATIWASRFPRRAQRARASLRTRRRCSTVPACSTASPLMTAPGQATPLSASRRTTREWRCPMGRRFCGSLLLPVRPRALLVPHPALQGVPHRPHGHHDDDHREEEVKRPYDEHAGMEATAASRVRPASVCLIRGQFDTQVMV